MAKKLKRLNSEGFKRADKIRLIELLEAAEVSSLDVSSDALNARERTYRENGIVLRVAIQYENTHNTIFGTSNTEYTYNVRRVPFSDYKVKQEIPAIDIHNFYNINKISAIQRRIVRKRFCIRVEFSQTGKIGRFCLSNLIIHLVSGLGLLTIAVTIIDSLILYVFPAKSTYRKYIFEDSPDLGQTELVNEDKKDN